MLSFKLNFRPKLYVREYRKTYTFDMQFLYAYLRVPALFVLVISLLHRHRQQILLNVL